MTKRHHTAPTPPQGRSKADAKRERLLKQGEAAKRRDHAAAGLDYDPRTAAGAREREIQNLGGTKRARSLSFGKLFKNKSEATNERCLACQKYEELWHFAKRGDFPNPRFEPRVDNSMQAGALPPAAGAKEKLADLVATIGEEGEALLYARIIENRTYTALCAESGMNADPRRLTGIFVQAVDAAARFFGLKPASELVRRAREARQSA
jgi:hypothetical protein